MNQSWEAAIVGLIAGVLLGGGSVELYHSRTSERSKEVFNQRLRGNSLAKKYEQAQSMSVGTSSMTFTLMTVDYSEAKTSCIAEYTLTSSAGAMVLSSIEIVDVGTDEVLKVEPLFQWRLHDSDQSCRTRVLQTCAFRLLEAMRICFRATLRPNTPFILPGALAAYNSAILPN